MSNYTDLFGHEVAEKKKKQRTIVNTIRDAKKSRQCVACEHWDQMEASIYGLCKVHVYGKHSGGIIYRYDTICKEKGFKVADTGKVQNALENLVGILIRSIKSYD